MSEVAYAAEIARMAPANALAAIPSVVLPESSPRPERSRSTLSPVLGVLLTANGFGALICLVGAGALIDATGYTAIAAGALLSLASLCAVAPIRAHPAATP